MFNKELTNAQKRISQLAAENRQLVAALESMADAHPNEFILKLIPENTDQFYVNGEFCVDESTAIYKSNPLTFSEAICWKAGKEVAKRAYEQLIAESDAKATAATHDSAEAKVKCQSDADYIKLLQSQLAESQDVIAKYQEEAKESVQALTETQKSLTATRETLVELDTYAHELKRDLNIARLQLAKYTSASEDVTETLYGTVTWGGTDVSPAEEG